MVAFKDTSHLIWKFLNMLHNL